MAFDLLSLDNYKEGKYLNYHVRCAMCDPISDAYFSFPLFPLEIKRTFHKEVINKINMINFESFCVGSFHWVSRSSVR